MKIYLLSLGDLLAILIVTMIGFSAHGEADISLLPRMAAIYFPLSIAWIILARLMGLFQQEITSDPKQLWRPALVMIFVAPLAAILRGLLLNAPIIPTFAVVLAAASAFGMSIWRGLYLFFSRGSQ